MVKKKSIKLNYIYNASYKILSLIAPLITLPYINAVFGPEPIGEYSYTASIVSYFTLVAMFGTYNYGNREIAYYQDEKERKKRSQVFWEIELFSIIMTGLVLVAYLAFSFLAAPEDAKFIYLIQIFSILAVAADITWLLQGLEEFRKVVGINMLFKILNIVFIFTAVKKKEDLLLYIGGMVVLTFLGNLTAWIYLPKFVDAPEWKRLKLMKHLKPTFILFVPAIASSIYTVLDKTMIGIFSTKVENGYYEQALKISKAPLLLVTALESVMIPRMGDCFKRNAMDELKELVYQSYNFVWFLGVPLCFGLVAISDNMVPWFCGEDFLKCAILIPILSFLILAIGISNVTGMQYFVSTKQEKLLTRTALIGAGVNVVSNIITIPMWGSVGAAISSVLAETIITIVQFVIARKEISGWRTLTLSWKYLLAGGVMLFAVKSLDLILISNSWATCLLITVGAVVYFAMLLLLKDRFFRPFIGDMLKRFGIVK